MKKWITKRAIPILLSSAMIVGTNSISIYGEDNEGICEHHTEHTAECGYQQGSDCTHEHTEECYNIEQNCIHEHTEECGYEQEMPCHYVCEICNKEYETDDNEQSDNKQLDNEQMNNEQSDNEPLNNKQTDIMTLADKNAEVEVEKPDGKVLTDTIEVKQCEHHYTPDIANPGKHNCVVCGNAENCTDYQYDNADSTETGHKGTCKVCGYKTEEQPHNFGKFEEESKDDGKNQVISYRATCQDCNYSKIVGTVSYPKNLKLEGTYGNTDDITLKVDVTGFENYKTQYFWKENHTIIELKEQNFNYTLPNKVSAGKHTYTYVASFFIDSSLQGQIYIDFTVDVKPLEITADIAGTTTKTYDGTVSAPPGLSIALNGVLSGDTVTANANFAYNSANVSEANVIKATNITLTGDKAKNYTLKENRAEIPANITKAQGVLIVPSAINKTFGDVPFLLQCSANSNGTITYTSSDENIAEVSQDGIVTLKSAGTVDIKASLSESENYTSAPEQKIAITVAKATPTVSCNVEQIEIFGISYLRFYITVTGVNGEALPTGYVEIIDRFNINLNNSINDGEIQIMTSAIGYAGNETFTVTYKGDNNYNEVVTTVTFDLNKKSQSDFNIEDVATKTYGDDAFELSTTGGNGEGSITYTSSDSNILSITGTTATIKKAGTVIITAVKDGDAEYNSASASISITINKKDIVLQSKSYSVIKGQALPTYEYEPVELAYSDTMTDVQCKRQQYCRNI